MTPKERASDVLHDFQHYSGQNYTEYLEQIVADAIREAVKAEREACIKAVCEICNTGRPVQFVDGLWIHTTTSRHPVGSVCRAADIRNRQ